MRYLSVAFAVALGGAGCGATPRSQETSDVQRVLAHDTDISLGAGTVTALSGFRERTFDDGHVELTGPEGDLRLAFFSFDAAEANDAFVEDAWRRFAPAASGPSSSTQALPERGWSSITHYHYPTSDATRRSQRAVLFVRGDRAFLALAEGTVAAMERRAANWMTMFGSLRTEGIGEVSWRGLSAHSLDEPRRERFRAFVHRAMEGLGVTGAAIGYLHGDEVYSEGFGVREQGRLEPVTPQTLFMIGSTSKSFLTLLQARLVDQGVVRWDEPVHELLPSFDFADHEVAQQVLLRHTVCACTGMPRNDTEAIFNIAAHTPELLVAELAQLSPTTAFGETYQYSNQLVAVGGYATAHRLHPDLPLFDAWDLSIREEVLEPLGMRSTTARMRDALAREHASPHAQDWSGVSQPIAPELEHTAQTLGPCGGLWSNVDDMLRYVRMSLAEGELENGTRLVSAMNFRVRETPGVQITANIHYGLGLILNTSHQVLRAGHGGDTYGFSGREAWYRDLGVGLVVLTNTRGADGFASLIEAKLLELVLGESSIQADARLNLAIANRATELAERESHTGVPSLDAWHPWLGHYTTDTDLDFTLRADAGALVLDEGNWHSRLGLVHGDPASLVLLDAPFAGVPLSRLEEGGRRMLVLDAGQVVYRFVQRAE